MMIRSGIISNGNMTQLKDEEIIPFLKAFVLSLPNYKEAYKLYLENYGFKNKDYFIEFAVQFLGYIIIKDQVVSYPIDTEEKVFNRTDYVKEGYELNALSRMFYENGKIEPYYDGSIHKEVELIMAVRSMSEENDASFWYPRAVESGFKTPNTLIIPFTEEEIRAIKGLKWEALKESLLLARIKRANAQSKALDLNREMFLRLGNLSNKFHFDTCRISNIDELYPKLLGTLDGLYPILLYKVRLEFALREFIKPSYQRSTIYGGMPLNTEFRVFYDFDVHSILGIYNYWDTNAGLDRLKDKKDRLTLVDTASVLESDFSRLKPSLEEEVDKKLPKAPFTGKWSVDFLYDGKEFVLIDMAHAECSYYYDRVLKKEKKKSDFE